MDTWTDAALNRLDITPVISEPPPCFFFNQLDVRFHFPKLHLKHCPERRAAYTGLLIPAVARINGMQQ